MKPFSKYLLSGISVAVIAILALLLWHHQFALKFSQHQSLTKGSINEDEYERIISLHDECFTADRIVRLTNWFEEKYYYGHEHAQKLAKSEIRSSTANKHKTFRSTENLTTMAKGGTIIGLYSCTQERELTKNSIMIYNVCVAKTERGKGYGRQLMKHAIRYCKKANADLTLAVNKKDLSTIKLYESLGFRESKDWDSSKDTFFMFDRLFMKYQPMLSR